jgi:hypothetical protein
MPCLLDEAVEAPQVVGLGLMRKYLSHVGSRERQNSRGKILRVVNEEEDLLTTS